MSRFVMVSFAFLGWGFFELSGGLDFTPLNRPTDEPLQIAQQTAAVPTAEATKFRQSAKQRAAALVGSKVLQEAPTPAVISQRPAADPSHRQTIALAKIVSAGATLQDSRNAFATGDAVGTTARPLQLDVIQGGLVALTANYDRETNTSTQNTGAQTASLAGLDTTGNTNAGSEDYLDLRQIRASRVNMRQGPGTIYPVLARLLAGDEVLVIEDSGTGWLQLRTKKGNKVGWVAASLVGKKRS